MTYMEALSKIQTAEGLSLDLLKDEALRTTIIDALTFGIKIIQYSEQFTEEDIMNDTASIKIKNLSRANHKGEWIQKGVVGGGEYIYECSECHHTDTRSRFLEVPFCWFCGTRMKVGDEGLTELKYMIDEKINYLRSKAKWEEADDFERRMRNIIARFEEEG